MSARPQQISTADRFLKYVEKNPSGCWLWAGGRETAGYGSFYPGGGRGIPKVRAHRWAYEHFVGPIPKGLHLDHLCRTRACVNPLHLEPVTAQVNLLRGETLNARWAARSACSKGHAYVESNTYILKGARVCRTCKRERQQQRRMNRVSK